MARNGAGSYSLPAGNPVVTGTVISSTTHNTTMSDLATAVTQSLAYDGQTVPVGNLPMGGFRHTGVGNAVTRTDYAATAQVQDGSFMWCGTAGGTANALTLSTTPNIAAYVAGQSFKFKSGASPNTGATTVAISGLAAIAVQVGGSACVGNEILANRWYEVVVDASLASCQLTAVGGVLVNASDVSTARATLGILTHGQCRLAKSGANLVLSRYNGYYLMINGVTCAIPSAGVSLAPTALAANTTFNIYAYMNAGVMTLEASTTTHATDTTTGIEIKSGDATRTLVGMARTTAGSAWADTPTQRFVLNWFNRRRIPFVNALGSDTTIAVTSIAELAFGLRCEFLTWADESVHVSISGYTANNNTGGFTNTYVGIDSGTSNLNRTVSTSTAAGELDGVAVDYEGTQTEGYHFATLNTSVSTGTSTYYAGAQQLIKGSIQG